MAKVVLDEIELVEIHVELIQNEFERINGSVDLSVNNSIIVLPAERCPAERFQWNIFIPSNEF
ncbi:hypothetical protein [Lactiplantibacillus pentosus]|uniref:hypothetical protein n=1 Tax=Lactiplantibacillus pentosus TaxID=1589 RepID=UPI00177B4C8B|nr:hypothetical protein [Lactiplantibacillus pentosus]